MAVRQYIGARYVTKIYENSLDPASAEWEASVNYEPLTMVTFNYGSYLSKKEVPASVGDPASNPAYWVQTGFYNGQIASLQDQIDAINVTILSIQDNVADNAARINQVVLNKNSNIILIGDSWSARTEAFAYHLEQILPHDDWYENSYGGSGFIATGTDATDKRFIDLLTELSSTVTDKDSIDFILVQGGVNDRSQSVSSIVSAITAFCSYAATNYPNATVIFMANNKNMKGSYPKYNYVEAGQIAEGSNKNYKFINAINSAPFNTFVDSLHVNDTGYEYSAQYCANLLLGGKNFGYQGGKDYESDVATLGLTDYRYSIYQVGENIQISLPAFNATSVTDTTNSSGTFSFLIPNDGLYPHNVNTVYHGSANFNYNGWTICPCDIEFRDTGIFVIIHTPYTNKTPSNIYFYAQNINIGSNY